MTRGTGSDHTLDKIILIEYTSEGPRNKILVDVKCLITCLSKHVGVGSVFELFAHILSIISNLMRLIDEGWKVRRAIYNSIYTLLKYVGFKDYFDIARAVDECSICFSNN